MPPLTLQEEGLTMGTSCPSHCPMSGWKCTATWAHPYSFAFLDEYVHSLTSRSLAFFIELRAEVDHTNIMS